MVRAGSSAQWQHSGGVTGRGHSAFASPRPPPAPVRASSAGSPSRTRRRRPASRCDVMPPPTARRVMPVDEAVHNGSSSMDVPSRTHVNCSNARPASVWAVHTIKPSVSSADPTKGPSPGAVTALRGCLVNGSLLTFYTRPSILSEHRHMTSCYL